LCRPKTPDFAAGRTKTKDEQEEQGVTSRERKEEEEKEERPLPPPPPSRLKQAGTNDQAALVRIFRMIKPQQGLTFPYRF
jgi:hypothetical protein